MEKHLSLASIFPPPPPPCWQSIGSELSNDGVSFYLAQTSGTLEWSPYLIFPYTSVQYYSDPSASPPLGLQGISPCPFLQSSYIPHLLTFQLCKPHRSCTAILPIKFWSHSSSLLPYLVIQDLLGILLQKKKGMKKQRQECKTQNASWLYTVIMFATNTPVLHYC